MRVAAAIATSCLLSQSGCSLIARNPNGGTVAADMGFAAATYFVVQDQGCGVVNEYSCEDKGMGTFFLGGPLVLAGLVVGGIGLLAQPDPPRSSGADGSWDGTLPARPTDAGTLQLARQVGVAVNAEQCEAARIAMDRIAARDAEYHIAMLAKGVLRSCP